MYMDVDETEDNIHSPHQHQHHHGDVSLSKKYLSSLYHSLLLPLLTFTHVLLHCLIFQEPQRYAIISSCCGIGRIADALEPPWRVIELPPFAESPFFS